MELLEFKNKILSLCKTESVKNLSKALMSKVELNDITFFDEFLSITDDTKDWLQALWQYYEADRTDKKQDYTPVSLCKLVSALAGDCTSLYDCCGGSGALTLQCLKDKDIKNVYIEELDSNVIPFLLFNLCLKNANGYVVNGNALTGEKAKCYELQSGEKYSICKIITDVPKIIADVAISNPPYNISWNPPTPIENDQKYPVIPPRGNANWAFVFECLSKSEKAVLILPCGIMSEQSESDIRKYFVDNDLIETVVVMPDKMFEVTSISTCILVINKNKKNKGVVKFIDSRNNYITEEREQNGQYGGASHTGRTYKKTYKILSDDNIEKILCCNENKSGFSAIVNSSDIQINKYLLAPSRYIAFEEKEIIHRDYQDIADNINYITKMQNACKLVINETMAKNIGLNIEDFVKSKKNSEEIVRQMQTIGIKIQAEDYIQFTKNKNEFIIKCNDKEILPDMLLQFFSVWKNQIALLNTMQSQYLAELRDALLPDLMSGKINI